MTGELVSGAMYHVVYRQQGGNYRWYTKEFVGKYLGHTPYNDEHVFSLRPKGGTGNVPAGNVISVERTEEAVYTPRSYREHRYP